MRLEFLVDGEWLVPLDQVTGGALAQDVYLTGHFTAAIFELDHPKHGRLKIAGRSVPCRLVGDDGGKVG
jgi:hypothetical protein